MNNPLSTSLLSLPRPAKRLVALTLDAFLCGLTVWMALCLRLDGWVPLDGAHWWAVAVSLAIALPVFVSMGLYRAIFRYGGSTAMATVVKAVLIYGAFYSAVITALAIPGVPRAVGFLQPALLLLMVGASRATARFVLSGAYLSKLKVRQGNLPKVLIYGAGTVGNQLAAAISHSFEMRAVGFLDDDPRLHGHDLNGLRIYDPERLAHWAERLQASHVLLAIPSVSRTRRNEILEMTRRAQISVRTLPSLMEMANGAIRASDLRELDIEDLLGRDAVPPNVELLGKNIRDKVVLVTGAGGSIGSELCRQIVKLSPKRLLLIDASEFALYAVHQELTQILQATADSPIELIPLLANVLDADRMTSILRAWHPHTIYHAAAYKHVPMVEHNPIDGVRNNVLGTLTLARAAAACGVSDFVLISTDKAVRPTNVMGASKRLAELVLQALAASQAAQPIKTRFSMVRFGNVLGSSGSVVPLFRRQIKSGGPVTLTHKDITRYFMTMAEAAQLVIQAGAMAKGGDVFVLDMGEPIRIHDFAKSMVELSGLSVRDEANPGGDIEIQITGLRPGEKLYEELLIGDDPEPSTHPRIMTARDPFLPLAELMPRLDALQLALDSGSVVNVRNQLQVLVPGYQPEGSVVDWVHLANAALAADIAHVAHEVSLLQIAESANEAHLKRSRKAATVTALIEKPDQTRAMRVA